VAIGLDTGEIEPDMMYEDRGKVRIDEFTISNLDNDKCQGWHNFRNALNYSCNVGMINIVQRVGRPLFYEYLKKFHSALAESSHTRCPDFSSQRIFHRFD
jgi:cell division protein FtsI/penicillin-binding protein 2